jgi:hypothetical protein
MTGLTVAPVETSARSAGAGGFGGHGVISGGMISHGGAPMIRPPVARIPTITPFAHLRHRHVVPGVVLGAPWYGYGDYYDPSAVAPEQPDSPTVAPEERPRRTDARPRRPGCVTETYEVPSEAGGKVCAADPPYPGARCWAKDCRRPPQRGHRSQGRTAAEGPAREHGAGTDAEGRFSFPVFRPPVLRAP